MTDSSINDPRLETERNIWISTTRHDGRPHLVPVWFVWANERFYICISGESVKAKNVIHNPHVSLALEDGSTPRICEGVAAPVSSPWPESIGLQFQQKYEWNIFTDEEYDLLLQISPSKWLHW